MDSSPSIWDIYTAAKRLLVLQPRIENRTLRESCKKSQSFSKMGPMTDNSMDSLSPLSVDSNKLSVDSNSSRETLSFSTVKESNLTKGLNMDAGNGLYNTQNGEIDMTWNINLLSDGLGLDSPEDKPLPFKQFSEANVATTSVHPQQMMQQDHQSSDDSDHQVRHIHPQQILQQQLQQHHIESSQQQAFQNFGIVSQSLPIHHPGSLSRISSTASLSTSLSKKKAPSSGGNTICFNCQTQKTPLWRRDPNGNTLCNACGLFQKLHGTMRPLSLKTDVIKKRNSRRSSVSQNKDTKLFTSLEKNITLYNITPGSSANSPSAAISPGSLNSAQQQRYKNVPILPKPSSSIPTASATSTSRPKPLWKQHSAANSPYDYTLGQSPSTFTNTPSPVAMPSPISPSVSAMPPTSSASVTGSLPSLLSTSASATNLTNSFNQKRIPQGFQRRESSLAMNSFVNPTMLSTREDEPMLDAPGDQGMTNDLDWLKFDM